jgi:YbbR domain-containing protein
MKKNFWLKVASLLLAVSMWLIVISRGQTEITVQVPVVFENLSAGLQINGDQAKNIELDIGGHERFIKSLRPGDVRIILDASSLSKGRNQLRVRDSNIELPSPLRLLAIRPLSISVIAEPTVVKTVPVKAVVTGEPEKGYNIVRIEVVPEEATLRGTRSVLDSIRFLRTKPLDVSSSNRTFFEEVKLDRTGVDAESDVKAVTVRIIIEKEN